MEKLSNNARIPQSRNVSECRLLRGQCVCAVCLEQNIPSRSGIRESLPLCATPSLTDKTQWNYILLFFTFAQELLFLLGPSPSELSSTPIASWLFTNPAAPSRAGLLFLLWPNRVAYQHITFLKSLSLLMSSALYQVVPTLFPSSAEKINQNHLTQFFSILNATVRDADQKGELYFSILYYVHSRLQADVLV